VRSESVTEFGVSDRPSADRIDWSSPLTVSDHSVAIERCGIWMALSSALSTFASCATYIKSPVRPVYTPASAPTAEEVVYNWCLQSAGRGPDAGAGALTSAEC
jgi:hypothetical protein